jgi:enterochelin esterase family protein
MKDNGMSDAHIRSPRIQRLERDLASCDAGALTEFWREVEHEGAPLVEPMDGDADRVLITFVYRADASVSAVAMVGAVAGFGLPQLSRCAPSDLFYRTVTVPRGVRTAYRFLPNPPALDIYDIPPDAWETLERDGLIVPDPLNPHTYQLGALPPVVSVIELPGADPQPWVDPRDGVPQGKVEPHRFESEILGGARVVWTYEPPGYDANAEPYPVLVLHDGYSYAYMPMQHTLDNLIAARRIPPIVCAFYQWADRSPELSCDETVARALAFDLMRSWLPGRLNVTRDSARTIIGGLSLGGLAAMFTAIRLPDVFGNVISQSGSFWWGLGCPMPADVTDESIEWEWLTKEAAKPAERRIRAFMEVGALESSPPGGRMPDMIGPNRRMRDALLAAGHEIVQYREYNGGHDYVCWRGSIADALIAIAGPWV